MSLAWDFPPTAGDDPTRIWEDIMDALRNKPIRKPKKKSVSGKGEDKEEGPAPPTDKPKGSPENESTEVVEAPNESFETKEPPVDEPNKSVAHEDGKAGFLASLNFWADKSPEDSDKFTAASRSTYGLNVYLVDTDYEPTPGRSRIAIGEERGYSDEFLSWEHTSLCGREDTPQTHSSDDDDSQSSTSATSSGTGATSDTESSSGEWK